MPPCYAGLIINQHHNPQGVNGGKLIPLSFPASDCYLFIKDVIAFALPPARQVAGWLSDALTQLLGDTIPSDDEAVKFIVGFTASLNDHNLKVAPSVQVMPSLTTLTPHYAV